MPMRGRWVTTWQGKHGTFVLNAYPNGAWSITSKRFVTDDNPGGLVVHWTERVRGVDLADAMFKAEEAAKQLGAVPMGLKAWRHEQD